MFFLRRALSISAAILMCVALSACAEAPAASQEPSTAIAPPTATLESTIAPTRTPAPTPSPTPSPSPTPEPTPTPDPDDVYFADEETIEINEDRTSFSYKSKTLSVLIEMRYNDETNTRYWVSHIRTRGEEKPYTAFSNKAAPGYKRFKPYRVARQHRAVYAQNGDFFIEQENPQGVVMREGVVYMDDKRADTMAIMPDGSFRLFKSGEITAAELTEMGVSDALSFGPILINDGEIAPGLDKARLRSRNPRSGMGMAGEGHYVGIVVEGMYDGLSNGATLEQYAQMFMDEGCYLAYNFDGGASSSMVFMGESCNSHGVTDGRYGQRPVPEIICFGKSESVPAERDPIINDGQRNLPLPEGVETVNYSTTQPPPNP